MGFELGFAISLALSSADVAESDAHCHRLLGALAIVVGLNAKYKQRYQSVFAWIH